MGNFELNARVAVAVAMTTYDVLAEQDLFLIMKNKRGEWEFPGGKLKPGETASEAAKREFLEETGHDVNVGNLGRLFSNATEDGQTFILLIFVAGTIEKFEPILKEHTEYRWVAWTDLQKAATFGGEIEPLAPRLRATVEESNLNRALFDRDVTDRDMYRWYVSENPQIGKAAYGRNGPEYPHCDQV